MRCSRTLVPALGVFALLLGLSGCTRNREHPTAEASPDIPIGFYAGMTGPTATLGIGTHNGVTLAIDEINASGGVLGRKFRLYAEDDQGKPDEAALAVTKLITGRDVVAIIGENASSRSLAAAPICQAAKVPMISPSSTNPEVTLKGDFIFRACYVDLYQGQAIARFVRDHLAMTKVAILRDIKNDYSVGLADYFTKEFTARGGRIVADQSYGESDPDFRAQLTAIRAASPEAIFIPGYYGDVGGIAIQARDLGIDIPLVGGDGWDSPKLTEIGGTALDGAFYAAHYSIDEPREAVQTFVGQYRERFGGDPDGPAALGYDSMMMLAEAIRQAGSVDRSAIRDRLAGIKDFQGVTGVITMGPDRSPMKPVAFLKVEQGRTKFEMWMGAE